MGRGSPPARQREALKFLSDTLFADGIFDFDPTLYNQLSPVRWKDWATRDVNRLDFPVHQMALTFQSPPLAALITPAPLQRLYDAEHKSAAADKLTVAELLRTTRDAIWSELDQPPAQVSDAKPLISSFRRNLQVEHLDLLTAWAEPGHRYFGSSDLHRMTRYTARELGERIQTYLQQHSAGLDFASRAHLVETASRVRRMLEAPYSAR